MAEQAFYMRKLLEDRDRFADFVNVNVFHGKRVLEAKDLTLLPNESGIVAVDSDGTKRIIERRRDVVMKAQLGAYFCIIASENQGKPHYAMAVREMMYDALDYTEQVRKIEDKHKKSGDKMEGGEFLSRFTKDDRLMPVITLTLYYGEPWEGPSSLYEMMGIDEKLEGIDMIKKCLPDYRINLIDLKNGSEVEKYRTSLQHVFSMVKYNRNKSKLYEYTRKHREEINHMDRESKEAVIVLLGEQKRLFRILDSRKEEDMDVCQAIDDLIMDGEIRGEQKGAEKTRVSFIRRQFNKHMTPAQAAGILELEVEYVETVMKLLDQYPGRGDEEIVSLLLS